MWINALKGTNIGYPGWRFPWDLLTADAIDTGGLVAQLVTTYYCHQLVPQSTTDLLLPPMDSLTFLLLGSIPFLLRGKTFNSNTKA